MATEHTNHLTLWTFTIHIIRTNYIFPLNSRQKLTGILSATAYYPCIFTC